MSVILPAAVSRRGLLRAGAGVALAAAAPVRLLADFAGHADAVRVAPGYDWDLVVRFGDPLQAGVPALDAKAAAGGALLAVDPRIAARWFGYNCDAVHFYPDPRDGRAALVAVNHEFPSYELMFPGVDRGRNLLDADALSRFVLAEPRAVAVTQQLLGICVTAIGHDGDGRWRHRPGAPQARRVTATTPIAITGPAAGHPLLRTRADPAGTRVLGTFGNCAGGRTPWGTFLSAEENVNEYFGNAAAVSDPALAEAYRRFPGWQRSLYGWEHVDPRFDLAAEPSELMRFGWVVELDPWSPTAMPRKRTALGRFQHEGATCVLARDGRLVVYQGDDHRFEYVYKYVSRGRVRPGGAAANDTLLDEGVLHAARFDDDGRGEWLPLRHGTGPLTPENGFRSQADVVIRTRAAADLLGATPMDRPEDIAADAARGMAWVALTLNLHRRAADAVEEVNGRRVATGPNAANPRGPNHYGHLLEIEEDGADCGALRFRWRLLALGGEGPGAGFGAPDNLTLDRSGNLWIVTDGAQPDGGPDGCWVMATRGPGRGRATQVMRAPVGAEVCGCEFTAGETALLLSIQHPGAGGTLSAPRSDWPDGNGHLARPSLIALRRRDGAPL